MEPLKIRAGDLKAGDYLFERDGYGFEVASVAPDRPGWIRFTLRSDGFVHNAEVVMRANAKVRGWTRGGPC